MERAEDKSIGDRKKQIQSTRPKLTEATAVHTGKLVALFRSQRSFAEGVSISDTAIIRKLRRGIPFYYSDVYCRLSQREYTPSEMSAEMKRHKSGRPYVLTAVHTGTVYKILPGQTACSRFLGVDRMTVRRGNPFQHGGVFCKLSEANKQQARSSHTSAQGAARADATAKNNRHGNDATTASAPTPPQPIAKAEEAATTPVPVPVPGTVAPLPIWQRLGPLTRGAEAYARAQRRRPWVTQVATMLVIYLCADISAQQISGKDEHEYARTARSLTIGGVAAIPGHMW